MIDNINLKSVPFEGLEDEKRYVYVCDMNKDLSRWSKAAVEYFDLPGEYVENMATVWLGRIHPEDRNKYEKDIQAVFSGKKARHNVDYRVKNKDGVYVTVTCRGIITTGADGKSKVFAGSIENHQTSEVIDPITGLYNIYGFMKDAQMFPERHKEKVYLIFGINYFSDINKNYGFEFGNQVLKRFTEELRSLECEGALLYRMDGIKFCLVMEGHQCSAPEVMYELISNFAYRGYDIDGIHVSFSISGGVVYVEKDSEVTIEAIQASLSYVWEVSKEKHLGELVYFNNELFGNTKKNLEILSEIRNCVFHDMRGFYLCYQPIIESASGAVCGMEALLRWEHPKYGMVSPGVFIPWLESDPCFYQLGAWVLRQALMDAKKIIEHIPFFRVNVNVSSQQISRSGFRDTVCEILKEVQFPAENLCMELTERVLSLNIDYLRQELEFFKNMGIKVALDDFGTGISSLNLLLELSVDELKIDRSFIKDIISNVSQQTIVETIAFCAQKMHLSICAEGVETTEIKKYLDHYGIPKQQGYLYEKPVVIEEFTKYLKKSA
ncbi:EAL domain-containing protein [Eubacterium oxidoreducens]|uniref:Diguanylate cyclase (GGDEF) domain-containing protein n=1 Tax=Eubacterium oxidoreducens TaxID=1732 RepID=A0A1G6A525_EUBOX|nr:EAL domain-containing protein [Eubacterium oxidoreducens]SDB03551.1 diguanylate cyclase (GGDEF) domain-containing protein [Eubacterium oxidoreducens]